MRPLLALAVLALLAGCAAPTGTLDSASDVLTATPGAGAWLVTAVGADGAEPTMGVTSSGTAFAVAFDFVMKSVDGGLTWEVSHEFGKVHTPLPPPADDPIFTADPMMYVDPDTDRVFVPQMFPILACSQAIWSDDDGATWTEKPMACGIPGVDHQRLSTGNYSASSPLKATPLYPKAVYYCYSKIVSYNCAVSVDGGLHFPIDRVVADVNDCGGPGGTPSAAPDGTVYAPLGGLTGCDEVVIGVSKDNGLSWTLARPDVGDLGQDEIDPDVTVTPDGTAYYAFRSTKDRVVHVISSTDAFATSGAPVRVAPADVLATNFAAITHLGDGRIAVAYVGTRDSDEHPTSAPDEARWHLFVSFSDDGGRTFRTEQVTPEDDPVQVGSIHYGGGGSPDRNLLEFIDAVTGPDGRVWVVYTDGCTDGCAGNPKATPDDSRARTVTVAVQTPP